MKFSPAGILVALLILSGACFAEQSVAGKWHAELQGYPWVWLNLTDSHGRLGGTVVFFALRRDYEGGPPTGTIGKPQELPLDHIQMNGNVLSFDVTRRSDHETLSFVLMLTSRDTGLLKSAGAADTFAKPVRMTRKK